MRKSRMGAPYDRGADSLTQHDVLYSIIIKPPPPSPYTHTSPLPPFGQIMLLCHVAQQMCCKNLGEALDGCQKDVCLGRSKSNDYCFQDSTEKESPPPHGSLKAV